MLEGLLKDVYRMMYCHYQQIHAIFANKTTFGPNHKQLITFKTIAHDASSCAKKYGIEHLSARKQLNCFDT